MQNNKKRTFFTFFEKKVKPKNLNIQHMSLHSDKLLPFLKKRFQEKLFAILKLLFHYFRV